MIPSRFFTAGLFGLLVVACDSGRNSLTEPAPSIEARGHELEDVDRSSLRHRGNQSATGHANQTVAGELRTFSFSAIRHQDGSVTGQFQLHNRASGVVIHGEVTCLLAIARPHQGAAFMGGVVTRLDGDAPGWFVGRPVMFSAFDNGEGANAPPDLLTPLVATTPEVVARQCALGLRVGGGPTPVEGGNIQVRP